MTSGVTGVTSVILDVPMVIVVAEVVEPVTATDVSSVTPLAKKITSNGHKRAKELVCLLLRECGMQCTKCKLSECYFSVLVASYIINDQEESLAFTYISKL